MQQNWRIKREIKNVQHPRCRILLKESLSDWFCHYTVGILLFLSQRSVEGTTLSDAMVNTVAGVIGMIPEGLVLLTSISFILGVGRLARKRALVQEMEAIEALARVNVLVQIRLGTITTGELKVKDIVPLGAKFWNSLQTIHMRKH